jgi:hypothetical protein
LEFCDFTREKGTVDPETLVKEFSGRQIDGHKVDAARVASLHLVLRQQRAVQGREMSGIKFPPGTLYAMPAALEAIQSAGDDFMAYVVKHLALDPGDLSSVDVRENE